MKADYQVREKPKRSKPANKNTTAHLPEKVDDGEVNTVPISGIHAAMAWIISQVGKRRRQGQGQVPIASIDGQESLWETMKLYLSFGLRTVPILDILHALSNV